MSRAPSQQLLLFGLVGAAGFVVDVGVLYAAVPALGWYGARAVSFTCAASFTWWFNRRLTFRSAPAATSASFWSQYLSYVAGMVGGAIINWTVYALTLHAAQGPLAGALGVALGSAAGMVFNFAVARRLFLKT